jgi:membrane protease YdiL (CAAX protease family)
MPPAKYLGLRLIPYAAVTLGLLVFKSAWFSLLGYHLGLAFAFTLSARWRSFGAVRIVFHPLWAGIAWSASLLAGFLLYWSWPGLGLPAHLPDALRQLGLTPQVWPIFMTYFVLVNPWFEEAFWRGWLSSAAPAPIAEDFWFAGYHSIILGQYLGWNWLILAIFILVGAAWLWRQIARQTNSLFIPVIAHLLADFSILLAIYLRTVNL